MSYYHAEGITTVLHGKQRLERAAAVKDELTGFTAPPPKPKTDDQTALF